MIAVAEQLREELYGVALRKLDLENELKSMKFYIATLKRELDLRTEIL